jgi:mono/diheme cytochrome c family protein
MEMRVCLGWCSGIVLFATAAGCGGDDTAPSGTGGSGGGDASAEATADGAVDVSTRADVANPDVHVADTQAPDSAEPDAIAPDAASDGASGGLDVDAGDASARIRRGEYLVTALLACGDCHTPRAPGGAPDRTKLLAGNPTFAAAPLAPDGGMVPVGSANLTPDPDTGLGRWTDDQIKNAFLNGIDDEGKPLVSIMPYYAFHNMNESDADAIVAYLRALPAVPNVIPEHPPVPAAAQALNKSLIPNTTLAPTDPAYASAVRGRYLAAETGACIECHTKHLGDPSGPPLDVNKFFAGGEAFPRDALGLPALLPAVIYSANITPATTGIHNFTVDDIKNVLATGKAPDGLLICPPMPVGPNGAYGHLDPGDATDIANYIRTLPPIENDLGQLCDLRALTRPEGGTDGAAADAAETGADGD